MVNHGRVVFYKAEISGFFINCDIKSYDDYENLLCIMYEFIKTKQNQHFQEFYQVYQKVPN